MNRRVIKEFDKSIYAIDVMLYVIMGIVGYMLLCFSEIPGLNIEQYVIGVFFIFGFISLIAYFLNRRKNDYEFLFFGVINIIVAVFLNMFTPCDNLNYVIAISMLFYSVAYFVNKIVHVYKLFKQKSLNFIPKLSISILIVFLTLCTMCSVYRGVEAAIMIYGYYFIAFGLLSLIEVFLIVLFNGKTFRKKMIDMLNYDEVKPVRKNIEIKKIKPVQSKRIKKITPVVKEEKEEVILETKVKSGSKKKNTKKKSVKKGNK